jgi:hypothetical protein
MNGGMVFITQAIGLPLLKIGHKCIMTTLGLLDIIAV